MAFASEQIVLVVGDDFNSSTAKMECYEDSVLVYGNVNVNIGGNGLGWGLGEIALTRKESQPLKFEGDGKAPIGVFKLNGVFGYEPNDKYKTPYSLALEKLICVDDSDSPFYNKLKIAEGSEKSFEYMKRDDDQYKIGVLVGHNKNALPKRGSCIFMHVQKGDKAPTSGCTSMKEKDMKKVANWLDESKNPILIQIPRSSSKEILELYPQLKDSELLKEGD